MSGPRILCGAAIVTALLLALVAGASASVRQVTSLALIEHWNGTAWARVTMPTGTRPLSAVVAPSASDVWTFGWSKTAENWDGTAWHKTTLPIPKKYVAPEFNAAAAVSPDDIWAFGDAENDRGPTVWASSAIIDHWNGHNWRLVPSPPAQGYSGLASATALGAHDVWAVGAVGVDTGKRVTRRTLALHWDGKAWARVPTPNPVASGTPSGSADDFLSSVSAVGPDDVWAVGGYYFLSPDGRHTYHTLVLHWDGKSWTQVPSPSPAGEGRPSTFNAVTAVSATNVWAAGGYRPFHPDSPQRPLFEHWNGSGWQLVSSPGGPVKGTGSLGADDLWAAATKTVVRWNGTAWSATPTPKAASSSYEEFHAVAPVSPNDVWAVGLLEQW